MVWVNAPLLDKRRGAPSAAASSREWAGNWAQRGWIPSRHTKFSMIDPAANPHDFWWFPYSDAESFLGDKD